MTDRENPIDERTLDRLIEDVGDERTHRLLRAFTSETQRRMERILALAVERPANTIVAAGLTGDSAGALARVNDL